MVNFTGIWEKKRTSRNGLSKHELTTLTVRLNLKAEAMILFPLQCTVLVTQFRYSTCSTETPTLSQLVL
jgi:hypothetical protein